MSEAQLIGYFLQNIFLYPCLYSINKAFQKPRSQVSAMFYKQACEFSTRQTRKLSFFLFSLSLINFALMASNMHRYNDSPTDIALSLIYFACTVFSSNFLLCGICGYLIMEQRLSNFYIHHIQAKLQTETLTDELYRMVRYHVSVRNEMAPINWLVSAGIIGIVVVIILVFVVASMDFTKPEMCEFVFVILTNYGRQILVVFQFLWEVSKVNEIYDEMLQYLAEHNWQSPKEMDRCNLYMAMKELSIGTTIFYYRPTRGEVSVQVGSSILAILLASFWAVVFA